MKEIHSEHPPCGRTIGVDLHPDSFTAAFLIGREAAKAKTLKIMGPLEQSRLEEWLQKETLPGDVLVLEASANSFAFVEEARRFGRQAVVLESQQCAQTGRSYCANDRSDAVKLARIYLSGLELRKVWVPDATTRLRREVFYAYLQAVKDSTRTRQRLRSFLNQHRIRLEKGFRLCAPNALEKILCLRPWEETQRLLLSQYLSALAQAHHRRKQLKEVMAQALLEEPTILRLIRLYGLRHITAYALAAFIGDISRFASPKKLVAYIGVNPGVADSGKTKGPTHLRNNGCAPLRALMVQAAQVILRCPNEKFAKWGHQLAFRRGRNRAAVAVARKLVTAVWHCLSGNFTAFDEARENLSGKVDVLIAALGELKAKTLGAMSPSAFKERLFVLLGRNHAFVFKPVS